MSYQYPEIRNFQGLYLQANSFGVPDGAMEVARNIEIQSDGIIQKTRGWYRFYTPTGTGELKGIAYYDDHLISFSSGSPNVQWYADSTSDDPNSPIGIATVNGGVYCNFNSTYCPRTQEQNQNLYWTADYGIYAIESFSGDIRQAGVPPALDLKGKAGTAATGPLPADSQSGYRIVFGRRDINGNLLLGSPSDVAYIGIPADGTGLSYTRSGAGPSWTVTVTLPTNAGFYVGQQIIVSNGSSGNVDGTQTLTGVPGTTQIQFSVAADPTAAGTLDMTFSRTASFEASIPTEITDATLNWFYQVYRTTASAGLAVAPTPNFALVAETNLSQADLDYGYILFTDDIDPSLVGAELYTNPNSREGELQANARPPKAMDMCLFKGYMIYSDITTRQRLELQLISPTDLNSNDLTFSFDGIEETYKGNNTGVRNQTVSATSVSGTGTITITYNAHGASNGWTVELTAVTGTVPRGTYTISGVTANTFDITAGLLDTATAIDFYFVTNGTNPVFYVDATSASVADQVENTAYYLVKAINRTSAHMYANYYSTFDDSPGKIRFETQSFPLTPSKVKMANAFEIPFLTPLPTSFNSGTQVYFANDVLPNSIMISKVNEPEAVPILQIFPVGARNSTLKRVFTLRDSVVILKTDGIFRLSGDTIDQFQITIIDSTVHAVSFMGADKINNLVHAISNQGLVAISESAVRIISRRIDDPIQFSLISPATLDISLGFGYETARSFYFSIASSILGRENVTYLYNVLNESWFDTDRVFRNAIVGPNDIAYGILGNEENIIIRQRKSQTLVDYSDEFATAEAIGTGFKTARLLLTGGGVPFAPKAGDVVLYDGTINRIESVVESGGDYALTFQVGTNIPTSGFVDVILYQAFTSTVRFAPFHAGMVGRDKFFAQIQIHLRQPVISNLQLSFQTETFPGSEETDWERITVTDQSEGWGYEPWGLFPWGLAEADDLRSGTYPSIIIRTLVPLFAARSTFIQPTFVHAQAAEPLLMQALSYCVRGYGERVTR